MIVKNKVHLVRPSLPHWFKVSAVSSVVFFALSVWQEGSRAADDLSQRSQEKNWHYTVKQNDSLHLICHQFCQKNSDLNYLATLNQLRHPNLVHPGKVLMIPVSYLRVLQAPAQVLVASGDVRFKKSSSHQLQPLNISEQLPVGATVQTGQNGVAKLKFADHSITVLQPNSSLTVEENGQYLGKQSYVIKLKLLSGRTEVTANPQHLEGDNVQVETPTAVAVVRGTLFRVASEDTKAIEETLQGSVGFSANTQEVMVAENYGTLSVDGQVPTSPQPLPAAPKVDALPKIISKLPVRFSVETTLGNMWVAQLAKDDAFNEIVSETASQTVLDFANLTDGDYYLKVRTQNDQGLQSIDATHAFLVKLAAPTLKLIAPLQQTLAGGGHHFTWESDPKNVGYLLQIASDAAFQHIVLTRAVSYNAFYLTQALPAGQYYWRIATKTGMANHQALAERYEDIGQFNF